MSAEKVIVTEEAFTALAEKCGFEGVDEGTYEMFNALLYKTRRDAVAVAVLHADKQQKTTVGKDCLAPVKRGVRVYKKM
jgi:hypothetical protein